MSMMVKTMMKIGWKKWEIDYENYKNVIDYDRYEIDIEYDKNYYANDVEYWQGLLREYILIMISGAGATSLVDGS